MKIAFVLFLASITLCANAQDSTKAFQFWYERNLPFAKQSVDEWSIGDGFKNAKCWLLLARVYNEIANNTVHKDLSPNAKTIAFEALKKVAIIDKLYLLTELDQENNALGKSIYNNYISEAESFYNVGVETKSKTLYETALDNYKKAFTIAAWQKQQGIGFLQLDTISVYNAARAAIKASKDEDALILAQKLSNDDISGINGISFQNIWQWQLYYYLKKKEERLFFDFILKYDRHFIKSSYSCKAKIDWYKASKNYTALLEQYKFGVMNFTKDLELRNAAMVFSKRIRYNKIPANKEQKIEADKLYSYCKSLSYVAKE